MENSFVPVLIERLSDQDGRVRERARHTLVLIGPPAIPALLGLAQSKDKRERWEAAKTLAEIADPSSSATQVGLLADGESDIRWVAASGVIRLGFRTVPDVLQLLIANADSNAVRGSVHRVLGELAKGNTPAQEIVAPLLPVLGETGPTDAVLAAADQALKRVQALQNSLTIDPSSDLP